MFQIGPVFDSRSQTSEKKELRVNNSSSEMDLSRIRGRDNAVFAELSIPLLL